MENGTDIGVFCTVDVSAISADLSYCIQEFIKKDKTNMEFETKCKSGFRNPNECSDIHKEDKFLPIRKKNEITSSLLLLLL